MRSAATRMILFSRIQQSKTVDRFTMRALLDTHTLVWALMYPMLLSRPAAEVIADPDATLYASAASAWEIATKVRLGKFAAAVTVERDLLRYITGAGYVLLSITPEVALRAGRLAGAHKDPFDRMIAAQALGQDIPVISKDEALDLFGVRRLW